MGYQTSETHEEFRAQPSISEPHDPAFNPRGFLIEGHLKDGPSQVFFASGILCVQWHNYNFLPPGKHLPRALVHL